MTLKLPSRIVLRVCADGAALDQLLKARAADIAERRGQKPVEPPAGLLVADDGAARRFTSSEDFVSDMQAPADPQNTLAYRGAKYAVIVLSALIILALIGLVVGSVMKLSGRSTNLLGAVPARPSSCRRARRS